MTLETQITPTNSLLLVMDGDGGEIPQSMDGRLVVSTPSCIAVGTLSQADGETSVVLTDETAIIQPLSGLQEVFRGKLETPNKEVHVCTVLFQTVVKMPVSSTLSDVEIYVNHESEPSKIYVVAAGKSP